MTGACTATRPRTNARPCRGKNRLWRHHTHYTLTRSTMVSLNLQSPEISNIDEFLALRIVALFPWFHDWQVSRATHLLHHQRLGDGPDRR